MRKALAAIAVALTLALTASPASATKPDPGHKVTLCHRTGSATNPYVVITTDIASDGYVKHGHTYHEQIGNGLGGDIIPAYTYGDFSFPGKNLDAIIGGYLGADILANGCSSPSEVDVCPNLEGNQSEPPEGYFIDEEGNCVTTTPTPTPTETPTPTPTPTHTNTPKPPHSHTSTPPGQPKPGETAFTGFDAGKAAGAAAALAALGGSLLWFLRRKTQEV